MNFIGMARQYWPLTLIVGFLLVFGFYQLAIGTFTYNDFTKTNTRISPTTGEIEITYSTTSTATYNNPTWGTIQAANPDATCSGCSAGTRVGHDFQPTRAFCKAVDLEYASHTPGTGCVTFVNANSNNPLVWSQLSCASPANQIVCYDEYKTSGSIEQTAATTTAENYDHFEIAYNETLNGGSVTAYLIYDSQEYAFTSKELDLDVPAGSDIKVKLVLSGSTSASPSIENNIVLSGSYTPPVAEESSENSDTFDNTAALGLISQLRAAPEETVTSLSKANPFRVISDLFFNLGYAIEGFIRSLFA